LVIGLIIAQVGLMRDGKLLAQAKPDYLIHSYGMSVCSSLKCGQNHLN